MTQAVACCHSGCYAVKGEAYNSADCTGDGPGASIANWQGYGNCVDITNAHGFKAWNDGCTDASVRFNFYLSPDCSGDVFAQDTYRGGNDAAKAGCYAKPPATRGLVAQPA